MSQRNYAHTRAQKDGKVRDFYICQICGSIIQPEGHHIINYQYGGAANADNIMTLCQRCHKHVHNGTIDLIKF